MAGCIADLGLAIMGFHRCGREEMMRLGFPTGGRRLLPAHRARFGSAAIQYFREEANTMTGSKILRFTVRKLGYGGLLLGILMLAAISPLSADDRQNETIDATAMGTSTQMGKNIGVKVTINQFSTQEDRQALVDAFKKGQSQGLAKALTKMKPVGRIAITGTLGYDLSYIGLIPSPSGRKIRFATNRPIRFAEAYNNGPSTAYDLTAGEFDLNDSDKSKNSGVLYPAAQLIINKEGQLQFELRRNPWKLVNIIDWHGAGSKE
jgi:hypothetical protein